MADFCEQCAKAVGVPRGDLAGLSTPEETAEGLFCVVICEGCGPIQVDHEGNCVSPDCYQHRGRAIVPTGEQDA